MDAQQVKILELLKQSPEAARNPMKYLRDAGRAYALHQTNLAIGHCNSCNVKCKTRTLATGPADAPLMVIMDYPVKAQLQANKIIGVFDCNEKIKTWMQKCFASYNVNFDRILWMNTVNCCPTETIPKVTGAEEIGRTPTKGEIQGCQTYVKNLLDIVRPLQIIIMGNVALNVFHHESVHKAHGKWIEPYCIPAMVTYSPNEIMDRAAHGASVSGWQKMYDAFNQDVQNAIENFKRNWPESDLFIK